MLSILKPEKIYVVAENYPLWIEDILSVIEPVQEYYFETIYWLEEIKMVTVTPKVFLEHMIDIVCHKFDFVTVFDYLTLVKISQALLLWLKKEFSVFKPKNTLLISETEFSFILCVIIHKSCQSVLPEIEQHVKEFL
jgi:hypothetical protein